MSSVPHPVAAQPPRRFRVPARVVDVALVVLTFGLTMAMLHGGRFEEDAHAVDGLGAALAALTALPLLWRRRWPLVVFAATLVPTMVLYSMAYSLGPPVGSMIALFEVGASTRHSRDQALRTALVVAGGLVLFLVVSVAWTGDLSAPEFLGGLVTWGASWFVGDRVRLRRERVEAARERAERAELDVERERRLATAEERTRIARDLHDSAGHAINVILVQAGAARLLQERDPARSREALETIEEVARETIVEIDHMVRALRDDDPDEAVEPPATLSSLSALAARHRAAGLEVEIVTSGAERPVPAEVGRAAYRIVQEALTNAAMHGSGPVRVELAYGDGELEITVTNPVAGDGPEPRPSGGHGIVGMRERAGLLGGELEAGRRDGVFRVRARLPAAPAR